MKLSEAIEIFIDAKLADGIADTTASWYRSRLARLCKDLDDCDLDQIDAMRLRRFIVSLRSVRTLYKKHPYRDQQEGTLSPSTRHGYVRVVRQFFGWFVHEGLLQENPASNIKLPKLPRIAPKDVTEKTMRALLRACRGEEPGQQRDRALILFLADTGCRVGGLVGLRSRDLDLGQCAAMVTEKGSKSRPVVFTTKTGQAVRQYLDGRLVDSEWVFPNLKTGDKMLPSSVNHILKRVAQRASLQGVRCNPHGFRHAFARQYINNGGDLSSLSDILGHSDIVVTKQFYAKFRTKELHEKHRRYSPVAHLDEEQDGEPAPGTAAQDAA